MPDEGSLRGEFNLGKVMILRTCHPHLHHGSPSSNKSASIIVLALSMFKGEDIESQGSISIGRLQSLHTAVT